MTEPACSLSKVLIVWPRHWRWKKKEGIKVARQFQRADHARRPFGRFPYHTKSLFLGGKLSVMVWLPRATKEGEG